MKYLVAFALCAALAAATPAKFLYQSKISGLSEESLKSAWEEYKTTYAKYYKTEQEEISRFNKFADNVRRVMQHNAEYDMGLHTYRTGINQISDMDIDEVNQKLNGYRQSLDDGSSGSAYLSPSGLKDLPDTVDWRTKGYVTPVKYQAGCGSCWAFSATGSLEGQHFRKTGKLVSLSEQNLVDCSTSYGNNGCGGGLMKHAFDYVKDNKGIDTELSYPYEANDDTCRFNKTNVGASDTGYVSTPTGDEDKLKEAVATVGPISISIDASQHGFVTYSSGVYVDKNCSSTKLNHGVLIVGYGTENGQDYWLVKNSWHVSWGEHGYVKMARNQNNMCGVATGARYPIV